MTQVYYPFPLSRVSEWPGTRPAGWAYHVGTDFAVPTGTPVPATASGRIVRVGDDGLGGFTIDLLDDSGLLHRFGHLSWGTARVGVNSRVSPGQTIALSGNSGMSTGPHLHWELRRDRLWSGGNWVDPRKIGAIQLGSKPAPQPAPKPEQPRTSRKGKIKMEYGTFCYKMSNGRYLVQTVCLANGEFHEYEVTDMSYIKNVAKTYKADPVSIISKSHYDAIKRQAKATRDRLDKRK